MGARENINLMIINNLRAYCRLTLLFLLWIPFIVIAQMLIKLFGIKRLNKSMDSLTNRGILWLIGVRVKVEGKIYKKRPVMYVSNHVSYIDILALGTKIRGNFIAKREVMDWPIFGWLSRIQTCIFVERDPKKAKEQQKKITSVLKKKQNIILFPEGTSTDGNRILPFKSSLFDAVKTPIKNGVVSVQPVTICYHAINGMPVNRLQRPYLTWFGDMDLISHVIKLAGFGKVDVILRFHEPKSYTDISNRKELAKYCEEKSREGLY